MNNSEKSERHALIICDLQQDAIGTLSHEDRTALFTALIPLLDMARMLKWLVVFSGIQFQSGYESVNPDHKLFGALARLNSKMGDGAVHWFMAGWPGSKICVDVEESDRVVWRRQHVPHELAEIIKVEGVTHAVVAGSSCAVQLATQLLIDENVKVSVARECVGDADALRLEALLCHLLPTYSNVVTVAEIISDSCGSMSQFLERAGHESRDALVKLVTGVQNESAPSTDESIVLHCSDCRRRGHGSRFIQVSLF